jgi:hypothetical protein
LPLVHQRQVSFFVFHLSFCRLTYSLMSKVYTRCLSTKFFGLGISLDLLKCYHFKYLGP